MARITEQRRSTRQADNMFNLFDALSSSAPVELDVESQRRRTVLLSRFGLNPAEMSRETLSNEYFRLRRMLLKDLRGTRSGLAKMFRRGLADDKFETQQNVNFLLTGATDPRDATWIDPEMLVMPTRGTLLEIGLSRRAFNFARIDAPDYVTRKAKAGGRVVRDRMLKPAYERVVPESTRVQISRLKRFKPSFLTARALIAAQIPSETAPKEKSHTARNAVLVGTAVVGAAGLYYWFTKEFILPIEANVQKAAETFMARG